jgi:hypothetical protein
MAWMLRHLWETYEPFLNAKSPPSMFREDWTEHRARVEAVLRGERPLPGQHARAPLSLIDSKGEVAWTIFRAPAGAAVRPGSRQHADLLDQYRFTLMLLAHPENRGLLRRCDECSKFLLGARAHQRKTSFCGDECRFAFNRKRRSKADQAAYMRDYRRRLRSPKRRK